MAGLGVRRASWEGNGAVIIGRNRRVIGKGTVAVSDSRHWSWLASQGCAGVVQWAPTWNPADGSGKTSIVASLLVVLPMIEFGGRGSGAGTGSSLPGPYPKWRQCNVGHTGSTRRYGISDQRVISDVAAYCKSLLCMDKG